VPTVIPVTDKESDVPVGEPEGDGYDVAVVDGDGAVSPGGAVQRRGGEVEEAADLVLDLERVGPVPPRGDGAVGAEHAVLPRGLALLHAVPGEQQRLVQRVANVHHHVPVGRHVQRRARELPVDANHLVPSPVSVSMATVARGREREKEEEEDGRHLLLDAERLRGDVRHLPVVVGVGVPRPCRRRRRGLQEEQEQEQQRHWRPELDRSRRRRRSRSSGFNSNRGRRAGRRGRARPRIRWPVGTESIPERSPTPRQASLHAGEARMEETAGAGGEREARWRGEWSGEWRREGKQQERRQPWGEGGGKEAGFSAPLWKERAACPFALSSAQRSGLGGSGSGQLC
jgi:hypothetical protein